MRMARSHGTEARTWPSRLAVFPIGFCRAVLRIWERRYADKVDVSDVGPGFFDSEY